MSWGLAIDDGTPIASLSYKLVRSATNNLGTIAAAESNGTTVMDWSVNTLAKNVTGLSAATSYYFAVLVKDAAGHKSLYTQQSVTTATPGWTWVSGSNTVDQAGTYGVKGVAAGANVPGARMFAATWADASGKLWLFGGGGKDSAGNTGALNDLWKFDGANWTWVSGSNVRDQSGVYGVKGVAAGANVPGARSSAVTWRDASGNLWLFGGDGVDSAGNTGSLNDLWKFDGTNWTWVSGSNTRQQTGTYGVKGVAAGANVPGARSIALSWTDASGNFWLFGGGGYDSAGNNGTLNDLWKFDGTNWTWVSGSNVRDQSGTYGVKGVAAGANVPGARGGSVSWMDASGIFWLFGGGGYDSVGASGSLNDLWKFDGTNWTWISGSNVCNQSGTYGTQGTAAAANVPGARIAGVAWMDASGIFWLFGGGGYDSVGTSSLLNDLWKFDGTNWTWVKGSNLVNQAVVYGTKGVVAAANDPGARYYLSSWTDADGKLWLFGGYGTAGLLNDLWSYQP